MSARPLPAGHSCRRAIALVVLVLAWLVPAAGAQCPGEGSCCEANGTPGCSLESCCFDICLIFDPSCCEVEWDQGCVDLAAVLCPFCADPPKCPGEGECFEANGTPGCDDEICCTEVCVIDATCCDVEWDEACAALALDACDAPCIFCPDGAIMENEPGCVFLAPVIPATAAEIIDGFASGDRFGHSVAFVGDVDGDFREDYAIGAYLKTVGGLTQRGRVYVFSGIDGDLLWSKAGEAQGDQFGFSVGGGGDVNNDGIPDVIVGARRNDSGGPNSGRVYAYNGINGASFWEFDGPAGGDEVGSAVDGVGDVNGDGRSDVVVSSFLKAGERGRVWVLSGLDGDIVHAVTGQNPGDRLGFDVAGLGDVNDDDVPDFGAGAYQSDFKGDNAGLAFAFSGVDASQLLIFSDGQPGDEFGFSISGAGDIDDDGFDDVIVGARLSDAGTGNPTDDRGQAFVYSSKTAQLLHTLTGDDPGDEFGYDVAGLGDADGDGIVDVIVGAPKAGPGEVHAFSGADGTELYALEGENDGDDFGLSIDGNGDTDDSGAPEALVGARLNDVIDVDAGRAYIFHDIDGTPSDSFNGGCFSDPVALSPIACDQSVCGTSGYDATNGRARHRLVRVHRGRPVDRDLDGDGGVRSRGRHDRPGSQQLLRDVQRAQLHRVVHGRRLRGDHRRTLADTGHLVALRRTAGNRAGRLRADLRRHAHLRARLLRTRVRQSRRGELPRRQRHAVLRRPELLRADLQHGPDVLRRRLGRVLRRRGGRRLQPLAKLSRGR